MGAIRLPLGAIRLPFEAFCDLQVGVGIFSETNFRLSSFKSLQQFLKKHMVSEELHVAYASHLFSSVGLSKQFTKSCWNVPAANTIATKTPAHLYNIFFAMWVSVWKALGAVFASVTNSGRASTNSGRSSTNSGPTFTTPAFSVVRLGFGLVGLARSAKNYNK